MTSNKPSSLKLVIDSHGTVNHEYTITEQDGKIACHFVASINGSVRNDTILTNRDEIVSMMINSFININDRFTEPIVLAARYRSTRNAVKKSREIGDRHGDPV